MKKQMPIIAILFLICFQVANAQDAPVTMAPMLTADAGLINVPITVTDFDDIGSVSLTLDYDGVVLFYIGFVNNSGFPNLTVNSPAPGQVIAGGFTELGGVGITLEDNSVLFTMTFFCNGGATDLDWFDNGVSCEYADAWGVQLNDSPTADFYINGGINQFIPDYAPILTIDEVESDEVSTTVSITAVSFAGIKAGNLRLIYDPAVALATDVSKNPDLGGSLNASTGVAGLITLGWFVANPATLADGSVLFTISFDKVVLGETTVSFEDDGLSCAWSNANFDYLIDEPFADYYTNGSLSFYQSTEWTGALDNDWHTTGNWTNGVPLEFVDGMIPDVVPNPFPLISAAAECNRLQIQTGAELTINTTGALRLGGNCTNNGQLMIKSSLDADGSFIDNGTVSGAGICLIERYLEQNMWHYVSPPIGSALSGVFYMIYLKGFSEESGQWESIVSTTTPLVPMTGYAAWADDDYTGSTTVVYEGIPNTGNYSLDLTHHAAAAHNHKGFNFVGNPYPSTVDWDLSEGWKKTNVDNAIWLWNPYAGNYGTYVFKDPDGGTLDVDNIIPAAQGFFVHVTNGFATGTLGLNNGARVHGDKPFFKFGTEDEQAALKLRVTTGGSTYLDEAVIQFKEGAGTHFEGELDAMKMKGLDSAPQLFTTSSDSLNLSINSLPKLIESTTLLIHFAAGTDGVFTLDAVDIIGFSDEVQIFLEDKKENVFFDLMSYDTYSFCASASDDMDRFNLHFIMNTSTIVKRAAESKIIIYGHQDAIVLVDRVGDNLDGDIVVYDISGRTVCKNQISGTSEYRMDFSRNGLFLIIYRCAITNQIISRKVYFK